MSKALELVEKYKESTTFTDVALIATKMADELRRLHEENESLRKDAERLDSLELALKNGKRLNFHKKNFSLIGVTNYEYEVFNTVRAAIDKAMDQTK